MFHSILKDNYNNITQYFEQAIAGGFRLPHSVIFYGQDILGQYYIALSVAKYLNCVGTKKHDCNCVNCKWVNTNSHPEVITISKIDSKPEDDKTKTVISEKQVKAVIGGLVNSSEYKRVFIFCDADKKELSPSEQRHLTQLSSAGFTPAYQGETKFWYPKGITKKVLQDTAANSLLKSIEEPPENTYFFFLTGDKEDLLQTIISRSQAFYVSSKYKQSYDTQAISVVLKDYRNIKQASALTISEKLVKYKNDNNYDSGYFIDCMQMYLTELLKNNSDHIVFKEKILLDTEVLQQAKAYSNASMKDSVIFDYIMLKITQ